MKIAHIFYVWALAIVSAWLLMQFTVSWDVYQHDEALDRNYDRGTTLSLPGSLPRLGHPDLHAEPGFLERVLKIGVIYALACGYLVSRILRRNRSRLRLAIPFCLSAVALLGAYAFQDTQVSVPLALGTLPLD